MGTTVQKQLLIPFIISIRITLLILRIFSVKSNFKVMLGTRNSNKKMINFSVPESFTMTYLAPSLDQQFSPTEKLSWLEVDDSQRRVPWT